MDVTSTMQINPMLQSAFAPSAAIMMRHRSMIEPLDCSPPVLDLCVRRRKRSPSPEAGQIKAENEHYTEPSSSSMYLSSPSSQGDSEYSDTSLNLELPYPISVANIATKAKLPRPFKAYPKDPLCMTLGVVSTETLIGQNSAEAYSDFRRKMLSQVQSQHLGTNKNMRRNTQKNSGTNEDPTYWEKRKKNNEAAKRSRDARRAKEDEIAIRCAFLEQENLKLKYEVATLRSESERFRNIMFN